MEHPVYDPILSTARYLGAEVRFFHRRPEDAWRGDPDEVARLRTPKTRLVVLTNLNNPTGAMADEEALAAVGAAAGRVGARVLVDEVYLDAAFERAPRSAVRLGPEFLTTNSLTKVYGASGLRCGWVLADRETAGRMWRLNDLFGVVAPHAAERLSVAVFGHLAALRERARALLDTNRRALHAFYDGREDLDVVRFEWGTTSFPRLTRGGVDRLAARLRATYETSVVPGAFFGRGDHFRIGLTADPATFAAGLERLGAALDGMK
jgi:aspartate/methionine/tyrosine aminotransferase